jgi:Uma2 family endonuclease
MAFRTFAEYVALEEATTGKHEYVGGQIYAMAGGTPEHSALAVSIATQLANQVRGGRCRVHSSDLRVRVVETGLATYPDVTVVCGAWERDPENAQTVVNPAVLVEVLSPSTEAYDRGEKLEHYKRISSLRAVVLVAHERRERRPRRTASRARPRPRPSGRRWSCRPSTRVARRAFCHLDLGLGLGDPVGLVIDVDVDHRPRPRPESGSPGPGGADSGRGRGRLV